jgi:hypothetical protein
MEHCKSYIFLDYPNFEFAPISITLLSLCVEKKIALSHGLAT